MAIVKTIGASGQISPGKEYAGQSVVIDQVDKGTWLIKIGEFIPHSERWLHEPAVSQLLDQAIVWDGANPPAETSLTELEKQLRAD